MPYIKQERRKALDYYERFLNDSTAGEFNYMITLLVKDYLRMKGESYQTYNDVLGALEGAKLELYRRKIAPYENIKIKENGDAY